MLEEHEFGFHASKCGDEEEQTSEDKRLLAPQIRSEETRERATDDTSDKST